MCSGATLLLLAALPALAGVSGGEVVSVSVSGGVPTGPAFASRQHTAVVAPLGHAATLDCTVLRLRDKSVSWVRSRDLQILSHAGIVFTADARVSASSAADDMGSGASRHSLRIERLRASDAGRYECQVNTEPKMSLFFNLTVVDEVVPRVVVTSLGVRSGSAGGAAEMSCEARYEPPPRELPLPPLDIRWTRAGETINLQSERGGVSLDTERWAARVVSRLTLAALSPADEGQYACSAAGHAASARLVLLHPDRAEAMQRDEAASSARSLYPRLYWLLASTILILLRVP